MNLGDRRRARLAAALPWLLLAGLLDAWSAPSRAAHTLYTSPLRTFACEVPGGWQALELQTPAGSSAHFLGPAEADGAWRAALHVHFLQKDQAGFIPFDALLKRERASDPLSRREASVISRRNVARGSARRFEVSETRLLPDGGLPGRPVILHHYYAMIPAPDGYFVVKLSTLRETYLAYRDDFDRALGTFQILGAP
ncbi:MAG: hypothetical protein HY551_03270 [Elusimicrobia bacterium]|nr:hypothetical protein [Elusimicrobiota bacterium]